MEVDGSRLDVQHFLALFDSLPEQDKAEALNHILTTQKKPTEKENESVATTPGFRSSEAHSCHVCKQLRIEQTPPNSATDTEDYRAPFQPRYRSNQISMTKELLAQGLTRKCLLVSWVFDFLAQSLTKLKNDVAQKGVLPAISAPQDRLGEYIDDLEYISAEGVKVTLFIPYGYDGKAALKFFYEPSDYILDKLWDALDQRNGTASYLNFTQGFIGSMSVDVHISTTSGNPSMTSIPVRPTLKTEHSKVSFTHALTWLNDCETKHTQCSKATGILPTRVIDVGTKFPIRSVRLYWSEEGEEGKYASLSYCWGGLQPLTTTRATAQDFTDGIVFSKLPKTLQDAMIVTSQLGLRYIWVDALCILQDDPEDVSREISRMAQIFQGAFVTISAAKSASVHDGFLSTYRLQHRDPPLKLPFQPLDATPGSIIVERVHRAYNHAHDPINLRAWTLQEQLLSTRMLVFGATELYWTCATNTTAGDLGTLQRKSDPYRFSLEIWRSVVRDYTARFLTYPADKLPAIAGVAAQYGTAFYGRYLAGLWEFGFLSELMWSSVRGDISRPLGARAPSWSWAAVDGEVQHVWCPFDLGGYAPRVLECFVSHVSSASVYGAVDAGRCSLLITGDMARVCWRPSRRYVYVSRERRGGRSLALEQMSEESEESVDVGRTQADALEEFEATDGHVVVWVFLVMKNPMRGLLLVQIGEDTFRRVGLVVRIWDEVLMGARFESRTVTIL